MAKSREAFRTISEVSDWLETPAHVLRFWESRFNQIKPVKRAGGRRYYRPADMQLLAGIKRLLHEDGLTIKGVQKILREQGVRHVSELGLETLPELEKAAQKPPRDEAATETNAPDILDEKPVRWIDPLKPEFRETEGKQEVAEEPAAEEPKRFGFTSPSAAPLETGQKSEPAQAADALIRQEAARVQGQTLDTHALGAPEIDVATSEDRILALYQRLQALRDRVVHAMQAG